MRNGIGSPASPNARAGTTPNHIKYGIFPTASVSGHGEMSGKGLGSAFR